MKTAVARAFAPLDPEPGQIFIHGADELVAAALGIKVFIAENQGAMVLLRSLGGDPEGAGMSEMKKPGGRRRQTASILDLGAARVHSRILNRRWYLRRKAGAGLQCGHRRLWPRKVPFPASDHDGRQAIAQHVDSGSRHVHELVNPEEDEYRFDGQAE